MEKSKNFFGKDALMRSREAAKLQYECSKIKFRSLVEEAEALVAGNPKWLTKKVNKILKEIEKSANKGKDSVHFYGLLFSPVGIGELTRLATSIAVADLGYYVSLDNNSAYIAWGYNWGRKGRLNLNSTLRRDNGEWNIDVDVTTLYKKFNTDKNETL